MTTAEVCDVFDQCDEMNVLIVCFLGGEPLIRTDILDILRSAESRNFSKYLTTNGHFVTDYVASALWKARFSSINVSLHGPPDIHDLHCGSKDAFEKSVAGIETLKRHGLFTSVHFVLSRLNVEYAYETMRIADELGVDLFRIIPMIEVGRALGEESVKPLDLNEWGEFYRELTARKIEGSLPHPGVSVYVFNCNYCPWELSVPLPAADRKEMLRDAWHIDIENPTTNEGGLWCSAAIDCCAVVSDGGVYPCDQMMGIEALRAGSVREERLASIWRDSVVFERLRRITRDDLEEPCRSCPSEVCSGSDRAAAYFRTGSLLGAGLHCKSAGVRSR